jgi:hypothetical protein
VRGGAGGGLVVYVNRGMVEAWVRK